MSRIGKMPVALPAGVTVDFKDGVLTVKGPKGTLTREVVGNISIETEGTNVVLKALDNIRNCGKYTNSCYQKKWIYSTI